MGQVPAGARNLNVHGRRPSGPFQGFGPLWQKTYTLRVGSGTATPGAIVEVLRTRLPELQPASNRFFPVGGKMDPGSVVLINAKVLGMPMCTGVVVMYSGEDESSLLTPQGHPESGWVTFSARLGPAGQASGEIIVQIESLARASDPVYEFALRFLGAGAVQESIWRHVLSSLSGQLGVPADVAVEKRLLDGRLQWSQVTNLLQNAGAWTVLNAIIGRA